MLGIDTNKAVMEIGSPADGKVESIYIQEGTTVPPSDGPLVISYAVMGGIRGPNEPLKAREGAAYYGSAEGPERFVFNSRYGARMSLRRVHGSDIYHIKGLNGAFAYQDVRNRLPELKFITDPAVFFIDKSISNN